MQLEGMIPVRILWIHQEIWSQPWISGPTMSADQISRFLDLLRGLIPSLKSCGTITTRSCISIRISISSAEYCYIIATSVLIIWHLVQHIVYTAVYTAGRISSCLRRRPVQWWAAAYSLTSSTCIVGTFTELCLSCPTGGLSQVCLLSPICSWIEEFIIYINSRLRVKRNRTDERN